MFPISSQRLPLLALASLLAMGGGCQRLTVISLDLHGEFDPGQVSRVRALVYELPSARKIHDGSKAPNEAFMRDHSVGIYLPAGVKSFAVRIDLYDLAECPTLSASGSFDLDRKDVLLVLNLVPFDQITPLILDPTAPAASPCVADGGIDDADASPMLADGPADKSQVPDAIPDSVETTPDTAECGNDVPPMVACFDPADAGSEPATPVAAESPSPDCVGYCNDMGMYCPGTFASVETCSTVCTLAGWRLPADGDPGMPLSCLSGFATRARNAQPSFRAPECINADVSYGACGFDCPTYCVLRDRLCDDHSTMLPDCIATCLTLSGQRPARLSCYLQILQHDVPSDRRFCNWTALDSGCGRCVSVL